MQRGMANCIIGVYGGCVCDCGRLCGLSVYECSIVEVREIFECVLLQGLYPIEKSESVCCEISNESNHVC